MKTPEEISKMSLLEFVLFLNSLTTTEICEQFNLPVPVFTGDVKSSANQFLQIDVILWRMVKEQAKSLYLLKQSKQFKTNAEIILDNCLKAVGCSGIKGLKFTLSKNAYKGIINAINTSKQ